MKENHKNSSSTLLTGLLITFILVSLLAFSYREPEYIKQEHSEHILEPFIIVSGKDEKVSEATAESLMKVARILQSDGFIGKELKITLHGLKVEGVKETIKPTTDIPLTYLEIQKITKALIKEHIQKPNSFIEEGYARWVASQVFQLDPHRFGRAVLEARTIRGLEEVIFFESGRNFTPRSRFQAESFVDFLKIEGYEIKDVLSYSNRFLSKEVSTPLESKWLNYLQSLPYVVDIVDLRSFLTEWDIVFAYVARTIKMIYPTSVKPLNVHYRALLHYLETVNRQDFDKEKLEIERISARLPKLREVKSVWDVPAYWDFASFWLLSVAICLFSFLIMRKIKSTEIRVIFLLIGLILAQSLTFFKYHIGLSTSVGFTLLTIYLIFLFFYLTDGTLQTTSPPLSPLTRFTLPLLPLVLLVISLDIAGIPFYEPSLLGFALVAVFYLNLKEPQQLGLSPRGFNSMLIVFLIAFGSYFYLPIKFEMNFASLSKFSLELTFLFTWMTLTFALFYHLLKPYFPDILLFLLAPILGITAELLLQKPLLYTEVAGFWFALSLLFLLTRSLPLLWALTIARGIVLIQLQPEASPYLFLPLGVIILLTILYKIIYRLIYRRRLSEL
ncbi:MAG: hypothetical protein DDT22_01353 [candidate division WS2 bacterium]|nr:hypothetical protein [Candidatus Lithacetigena glycinireducens]